MGLRCPAGWSRAPPFIWARPELWALGWPARRVEEHLWGEPGGGQDGELLCNFGQILSQPSHSGGKESAKPFYLRRLAIFNWYAARIFKTFHT